MRYIGIFQIMEPRNLLKPDFEIPDFEIPDFEISVTFESLGIFFLCVFHCCAQENELCHLMYHHNIMCLYLHWGLFNLIERFCNVRPKIKKCDRQ